MFRHTCKFTDAFLYLGLLKIYDSAGTQDKAVIEKKAFVVEIVCDDVVGSVKLLHKGFDYLFRGHIDIVFMVR